MSKQSYTPGPWKIHPDCLHESESMWRAVISEWDKNGKRMSVSGHIGEANARLIAAAPDLLEALRWYVEMDEVSDMPGNEFYLEGRERARASIAKALGE